MSHSACPAQSHCSPVLTPLAYWLGQRFVLPWYFQHITITGQAHLPTQGPVILAPTHRARWDSIVLPLAAGRPATGRDLRYMVTADEVQGVQGWFIRRLGGFAVNVRRPTIASLRHGIDLLLAGEMLVIYPEGGIFRDREVHRLKPGLARLAVQAQMANPAMPVQVVPVSLHYSPLVPKRGCTAQVDIGPPLAVNQYIAPTAHADELKQQAKTLTADLQAALVALHEADVPSPTAVTGLARG